MTRPAQKRRERNFVEEAARTLGKIWRLGDEDREHPDFIITEDAQQVALEVREIFMGPQNRAGSSMKAAESRTQKIIDSLRRDFEATVDVPLTVKFVGPLNSESLAPVLPALLAENLAAKPLAHHTVLDSGLGLRVHVTKALRPNWYSVNDRVGFVDRNPQGIIARAIETKAQELSRYQQSIGLDVWLLLVADRIQNSGKILLEEQGAFDFCGFQKVYLFPYPEAAFALNPIRSRS